ncbi:hypothetical protein LMH73_017535 [Vibrio splendidus]|nr:hypothetical protein [Vibrio splendidus]MCC4880339.1 hypothetical protein [Vibrio splendidus]
MIIDKIHKANATQISATVFSVDGVEIHAYGVLHGISGGSDSCYVDAVNRAIDAAPGAKYCEKSMKRMYKGLHYDVSDWLVFRPIDTFRFAAGALSKPAFMFNYIRTSLAEKMTMRGRFGENTIYSLCDAPSSVAFHGLSAYERRELRGLPSPEEYLRLNIMRWEKGTKRRFRFSDRDWAWLDDIEPNACIPLRSIHMLEYVIGHAKSNGYTVASMFCGDIHSSDMDWYSTIREDKDHFSYHYADKIRAVVSKVLSDKKYLAIRTLNYYLVLAVGAALALTPYLLIGIYLCYINGIVTIPYSLLKIFG